MKRLAVIAALALLACKAEPKPEAKAEPSASAGMMRNPTRRKLEVLPGPGEGSVAAAVHAEAEKATSRGRQLVVYVGAHWCEPCMRFHRAAEAGELDGAFPTLTILEFDLDRDRDRLAEAGYVSKMIPLFALPRPDGNASGAQVEGSINGDGAVAQIQPRLTELLAKAP